MNLSNNNFKDDFEKNRQSIDPKEHRDDVKDSVNDSVDNVKEEVSDKQDEQFPPRNAQRRQRRRDTATHQNEGNESPVDEKMIHLVNKTVSNNRKHIHHPRRLRMKPIKIKTLQKITILIKIEVKKITTFLKVTNLKIKMIRKKALP